MSNVTNNIVAKLGHFYDKYLHGIPFVFVAAIIIGLMCGIGAGLLKLGIKTVTDFWFGMFDLKHGNITIMLLPFIGVFAATALQKYIIKQPMDHASERIVDEMGQGKYNLSSKLIWGPIVGCSITLGSGGSAGAEDPIAYTGAALGSNLGRLFKLTPQQVSNMLGLGAAAAIGGIYMAPIGGVMFALEVLKMRQTLESILAIVMASLTAALTTYIFMGCHTDVSFSMDINFDMHLIPYVIAGGIFCGLYSVYYCNTMRAGVNKFGKVRNIWVKTLIGSAMLAVMLYVFPSLYGEGFGILTRLMDKDPMSLVMYGPLYHWGSNMIVLMALMGVILLLKPIATSATNDSGGVGGDFTPTLYSGGIAGFLFAALLNTIFGLDLPYPMFAFLGMSAVMSGAIRAPLMAIFIAAEMTGFYGFILPLTIGSGFSFVTTVFLSNMRMPLPFLHKK